jgi:two-component system invasion response regulator UvrY
MKGNLPMISKNITVVLVDDHTLVRTGLKALLHNESDITVVGEASSGDSALKMVRQTKPNIVLMDIKMPGGIDGLEATRRIGRYFPNVRVIAVTSYDADPNPAKVLDTGAAGFLAKDCTAEELLKAIRCVHRGKRYISADIAQELAIQNVTHTKEEGKGTSELSALSHREMQILLMLGNGLKVQKIAEKLIVSPKTINTYRYRLYRKLGAETDVDLTHIAIRHKLIEIEKRKQSREEE